MGAGWRRFTEKAKQKWHMAPDKGFAATSNSRNELMLTDAGEFAGHLKRCEKDIRGLKNATEGLINTTKIVMSAPLPKVYEDVGGGKMQPVVGPAAGNGAIGGDFRAEELQRVARETAKKLEAEVLAPMQRWTTAYNTVQQRMTKLEGVRLEVDSRRRTVAELGMKIDRQRARLPQTRSKGEFEMEQTIKKMQHKENKLAAARQSFKEQESLVFQQLAQLIRDAVWLKSYIAAVMRLEQEAFTSAYQSLGETKAAVTAPGSMPVEQVAVPGSPLPVSPEAGGAYPGSSAIQAGYNVSKVRRQPSGKENGVTGAWAGSGKADYVDLPPAPTGRITRAPSQASGYDRYGDQTTSYTAQPQAQYA
jgi:hypothetical protein